MNLNCFYVVLIYSMIIISNGFLHTIVKVIENYSKGLTSQKVGVVLVFVSRGYVGLR